MDTIYRQDITERIVGARSFLPVNFVNPVYSLVRQRLNTNKVNDPGTIGARGRGCSVVGAGACPNSAVMV